MLDGVRVGVVAALRRFPLRSAGGEDVPLAQVLPGGLDGDRRWVVERAGTGEGGGEDAVVRAKEWPALAGLRAAVVGGALVVEVEGTPVGPADLDAALTRLAGTPLRVRDVVSGPDRPADGSSRHSGGAAVHVISAGAALAEDAPAGCDPGERANVVLELDPAVARPGAERSWVGRRLRVGRAQLAVARVPRRCLGVYAEVLAAGGVALGDEVVLLDSIDGGAGSTAGAV